ncbi:unnamed protein product [Arabis nemorensis]|uniref:Uncharacterized protein n=1 Tax=Arabis nemorensis TaxID=586526 RepID=A0A565BVY2_9BRAS|nr:unnamed protein product [Arabis nemorensis]
MFALFHKTAVAADIPVPAGLRPHSDESKSAFEDGYLARDFLFALKDNVFCLLHERIDNISDLGPPFKVNVHRMIRQQS